MDLISRTVHIKIYPTARTFAERTEVLRVLERFGQVDYFRSLKFEGVPNAFITIFNKAEAAEKIINSSPVRYRLISEPAPDTTALDPTKSYDGPPDSRSPETKALDALNETGDIANENTAEKEPPQERLFEIRLSTSQYPHRQIIRKSPLYGAWRPISPNRSAIAADLLGKIPREKLLSGLRDWETGALGAGAVHGTSSDDWSEESENKETRFVPWTDSLPWRLRGKIAPDTTVIRSLQDMYMERQKRVGDKQPEMKA